MRPWRLEVPRRRTRTFETYAAAFHAATRIRGGARIRLAEFEVEVLPLWEENDVRLQDTGGPGAAGLREEPDGVRA